MSRQLFASAAILAALAVYTSCSNSAPPPSAAPQTQKSPPAEIIVEGSGTSGLAELSDADRKLAEKQKVCPVTGKLLGSMGTPYKVTVKGRVVFLCCDGCEETLKADPDKYLKKLK
jgi:YHS domain-containing protein